MGAKRTIDVAEMGGAYWVVMDELQEVRARLERVYMSKRGPEQFEAIAMASAVVADLRSRITEAIDRVKRSDQYDSVADGLRLRREAMIIEEQKRIRGKVVR